MSFLKRLFGGAEAPDPEPVDPVRAAEADAERDRELLREDARRLGDDLLQRQLRYADRSWTPPAQGGTRRADDTGDDGDGGER